MDFGKNFLPQIPSRWTQVDGTVTEEEINISPGGWVSTFITEEDIPIIPNKVKLVIIADTYTNTYTPTDFVDISIVAKDEKQHINIMCPIVNVKNNIYTAEIDLYNMEYLEFRLVIRSVFGIRITSWELLGPTDEDLSGIVDGLKDELPRLLHDYNTARITVEQQETTIALISARLIKNTSLNGHLQITYTATEDATLVIRMKDNMVSELFTPILYDIEAGRGSIGIPHAYVEKFIGIHTFTVTAQVTTGSILFDVRSILYTIDGGHLAERIMDVGMNVRDIALRRRENEAQPSWIYAIGIDDGQAMVRARPYNESVEVAWEPVAILGEATEAAIEFDGDWRIYREQYRFETEGEPWCFWVDDEGILFAQQTADEETKIQLMTGVLKIAAVKGYRNINYIDSDHGLIIVYIKEDNLVYYRTRCVYNEPGVYAWENERQVEEFTGTAVDITAFRTNDYRVGINIADADGTTTTLITTRNWAGIGIRPEHMHVTASASVNYVEIIYHNTMHEENFEVTAQASIANLYAGSYNIFKHIENIPIATEDYEEDYGQVIHATVRYRLTSLNASDFNMVDADQNNYGCVEITELTNDSSVNNWKYALTFINFNAATNDLRIECLAQYTKNEAGYLFDTFEGTFTAIGLDPSKVKLPEPEEAWNE